MTNPGQDPRQDLGSWSCANGDPLSITLNFKNPDGSGVNLNTAFGTSWTGMLRQRSSSTPAVSFTVDSSNAATGVLVLTLTGTQTATMSVQAGDVSTWHFDLQATGGTVSPTTPFRGTVTIVRDYTHA